MVGGFVLLFVQEKKIIFKKTDQEFLYFLFSTVTKIGNNKFLSDIEYPLLKDMKSNQISCRGFHQCLCVDGK